MREAMRTLQRQRRESGNYLPGSARIRPEGEDGAQPPGVGPAAESESARYFREQFSLVKKLGGIADRLFHVEVPRRKASCQAEIEALNAEISGGSPVCRADDGVVPLVRIPPDEVHVFRSKARTPVLVLMEVVNPPPTSDEPGADGDEDVDMYASALSTASSGDGSPGKGPSPPSSPTVTKFKRNPSGGGTAGAAGDGAEEVELGGSIDLDNLLRTAMKGRSLSATMSDMAVTDSGSMRRSPSSGSLSGYGGKRRISAFKSGGGLGGASAALNALGEGRREVLETIKTRKNSISKSMAENAQRKMDEMDQQRQTIHGQAPAQEGYATDKDSGYVSDSKVTEAKTPVDEHQVMTSLRMLLLKTADADMASMVDDLDASSLDTRLSGCGTVNNAIVNAVKLYRESVITGDELLECVVKDRKFQRSAAQSAVEDSSFWVNFAFGEKWESKKKRIAEKSPEGHRDGWDLVSIIVKANDDVRQEVFAMQLIELCAEAWNGAGLELWVQPYRILATGSTTGIIECIHDALSLDALKKRESFTNLKSWYNSMGPEQEAKAKKNFVRSLAAYSVICYLLQIKDRHNGNILIDHLGHLIHIDFGFLFGIAPGNAWSLETAPFKLTTEMMDLLGGTESPLFAEFVTLFVCGFLALREHEETFLTVVEITARDSSFPCFKDRSLDEILSKFRDRFCGSMSREDTVLHCLNLIKAAYMSQGTYSYDKFQNLTQGIAI